MDNLCHTLVGAALAECGLKRWTALGAGTLMIAANFPDIDIVAAPLGHGLGWRRGATHGLLALVVLPLVLSGLVLAWDRLVRRRRDPSAPAARGGALLALSAIGIFTHPVLDWMNSYGMRWLMPFSGRWFYGDALFIVDPWLWLTLGGAVLLARAAARGGRSETRARWPGTRLATWATGIAAAYAAATLGTSMAGERLVAREMAARGPAPRRIVVGPTLARPLAWDVVLDEGDAYRFGTLRWLDTPRLALHDRTLPTNAAEPAARAAREDPAVREMLGWARLPFFVITREASGTTVRVDDARYGAAETPSWAAVTVRVPR
jgi:inner membrane protein